MSETAAGSQLGGATRRRYPFPGDAVNTIPVGLDAASLPHTLPGKAPRPGLLVAVAPQSRSNLRFQLGLRP